MSKQTNKLLTILVAVTLAFATFGLAACGGSNSDSAQQQDNCYGDDMPVINE